MMDISLITDSSTVATQRGLGLAKLLLQRQNFVSNSVVTLSDSLDDQSVRALQISSAFFDAVAPPPVKSNTCKSARRTLIRKKRRTRRKFYGGDGFEDGGQDYGFFGGDGGGSFNGGGGGWGGGRGWNFDRFGGQNWDESAWFSSSDFAYGFVYEVIYWIALSNCVHFAFKRFLRILANGITADAERDKVSRFTSMC